MRLAVPRDKLVSFPVPLAADDVQDPLRARLRAIGAMVLPHLSRLLTRQVRHHVPGAERPGLGPALICEVLARRLHVQRRLARAVEVARHTVERVTRVHALPDGSQARRDIDDARAAVGGLPEEGLQGAGEEDVAEEVGVEELAGHGAVVRAALVLVHHARVVDEDVHHAVLGGDGGDKGGDGGVGGDVELVEAEGALGLAGLDLGEGLGALCGGAGGEDDVVGGGGVGEDVGCVIADARVGALGGWLVTGGVG